MKTHLPLLEKAISKGGFFRFNVRLVVHSTDAGLWTETDSPRKIVNRKTIHLCFISAPPSIQVSSSLRRQALK
jgi:hypothetical protein